MAVLAGEVLAISTTVHDSGQTHAQAQLDVRALTLELTAHRQAPMQLRIEGDGNAESAGPLRRGARLGPVRISSSLASLPRAGMENIDSSDSGPRRGVGGVQAGSGHVGMSAGVGTGIAGGDGGGGGLTSFIIQSAIERFIGVTSSVPTRPM